MSTSVQFDSVSLQNVNRVVQSAKHDSSPEREMEILPLARNEGGVLVSEHYQPKVIVVNGVIKATSQENLENEIDSFKELMSRKNVNLDIGYAGGTRRYLAYARAVRIDRDFYHKNFAPYEVEFVAPGGVGKNTAQSEALDGVSADPTYTGSVSFSGSAEPKPVITLLFGANWSTAVGLKFKNVDTDESCIINRASVFSDGDELIIDCENKSVKLNDMEIGFYRVFPSFAIGSNNIEITAGDILDQEFDPTGKTMSGDANDEMDSASEYTAQSFTVPHTDDSYQGISIFIRKAVGTGSEDLTVEIQTDNAGDPSGSAVSNAEFTIDNGDVTASGTAGAGSFVFVNSASRFELESNTIYWIVCKPAGAGTIYLWDRVTNVSEATYGRGHCASSSNGGSDWTHHTTADRGFRLYYGGKVDSPVGELTLDIDYTKRYL